MKKLLISAVALFTIITGANAQAALFQRNPAGTNFNGMEIPASQQVMQRVNGSVWFSYCTSSFADCKGMGVQSTGETYYLAVYIPGTGSFLGKKINAVQLPFNSVSKLSNVKVWLAKELDTNIYEKSVSSVSNGFNTVTLDSAYTITSEGIFVGYQFDDAGASYQMICGGSDSQYGFYAKTSKTVTSWGSMNGAGYGSLALKVSLNGEFLGNAASFSAPADVRTLKGTAASVSLSLSNAGVKQIKSIDYTLTYDGNTQDIHYNFTTPVDSALGSIATVPATITGSNQTGVDTAIVKIVKVNGVANEFADQGVKFTVTNMSKLLAHKTVVEEYTGTGCGWCPRGWVGMNNLRKTYPDKFIGIAAHGYNTTDPMYYGSYPLYFGGAPSCYVDRHGTMDPYYGTTEKVDGILNDFAQINNVVPTAAVKVSPTWSADSSSIVYNAEVEFATNEPKNHYAMFYAVVEDSMSNASWSQSNYYYTYYTSSELPSDLVMFAKDKSSSYVTGLNYNDVCLKASAKAYESGSLVGDVIDGGVIKTSGSTRLSLMVRRNKIQNYSQIRLVALCIDTITGYVVNAAESYVGAYTTGIDNATIDNSNELTAHFSTNGGVLTINTNSADNVKAEIYSVNGAKMAETNISGRGTIPVQGLHGVYVVRVSKDNKSVVEKLIF